jgi:MFS family permease
VMRAAAGVRRRSLRASVLDGTFHAGMVGFGETFFAAFALALGATPLQVGLLATLPILAGSLVQLAAPLGAARVGQKPWVVASSTLQALVFLPIASLALSSEHARYVELLLWVCVYWALALGINPAWNAWMGRLVPEQIRSRFFGRRNAPIHATLAASVFAAGWVIELGARLDLGPGGGFAISFAIAAAARLASAWFLSRQVDPGGAREIRPPVVEVLSRFRVEPYGRLILLIVTVNAAVHVSAAYFTPFMLRELGLSYVQFTALTGAIVVSRVLSSPYWGLIASSYGNRRALQVSGAMLVLLPVLWLVSDSFAYLLGLQIVAGFAWAGFELATFLTFFDCTTERNRASVLTAYNLLNGVAIVVGSLLGGSVLALAPLHGYAIIFAASTMLRALALAALAPGVARRPGAVEHRFGDVFLRVVTLRPGQDPDDRPIILPRRR